MRGISSEDEIMRRLISLHTYWHNHDKGTTLFNYSYLRKQDSVLISAIDRKVFGIHGLPEALKIAGINPLCHLKGVFYGRSAPLEVRKERYLMLLSHLASEIGDLKQLNDSTINSGRTIIPPPSIQENEKYEACEALGCQPLPITYRSIYARGRDLFGNWNRVLMEAGFNYRDIRRKKPKYKRAEVMRDLIRFMKKTKSISIADIRRQNTPLYKGIFNSHAQSLFKFANHTVTETAFIEMDYYIKKQSDPTITPESFYELYRHESH